MPSILSAPIYTDAREYTGDPQVPTDVETFRFSNLEMMQRFGTPCLVKRIYTIEDVENGVAQRTPVNYDDIYGQSSYITDQLSYGVGFCSVATQDGEWYDPATGNLYISSTNPNSTYLPAPKYRGYGPGFLIYAIMPDRPEDVLRFTQMGTLVRQQNALAKLPWWPMLGDNDLLIPLRINPNGTIAATFERYQLKMVSPITLRGHDRFGNREFDGTDGGNRYWIGQQAELMRVPYSVTEPIFMVETDR